MDAHEKLEKKPLSWKYSLIDELPHLFQVRFLEIKELDDEMSCMIELLDDDEEYVLADDEPNCSSLSNLNHNCNTKKLQEEYWKLHKKKTAAIDDLKEQVRSYLTQIDAELCRFREKVLKKRRSSTEKMDGEMSDESDSKSSKISEDASLERTIADGASCSGDVSGEVSSSPSQGDVTDDEILPVAEERRIRRLRQNAKHGKSSPPSPPSVSSRESLEDAEKDRATSSTTSSDDQVYCICREVSYGQMIACDNKNCPYEWFHYKCVGLSSTPKGRWFCEECSRNLKCT